MLPGARLVRSHRARTAFLASYVDNMVSVVALPVSTMWDHVDAPADR